LNMNEELNKAPEVLKDNLQKNYSNNNSNDHPLLLGVISLILVFYAFTSFLSGSYFYFVGAVVFALFFYFSNDYFLLRGVSLILVVYALIFILSRSYFSFLSVIVFALFFYFNYKKGVKTLIREVRLIREVGLPELKNWSLSDRF